VTPKENEMTSTETQTAPATAKKATPATKAPATKAAKTAPAKAAPKPAAKAAAAPAPRKLRWKLAEPKVDNKPVEQSAESEGHAYSVERSAEAWRATHTFEGKTDVLVEGGFGAAYQAAVKHNRERA
jgi:hypothetical protein